MDDHRPARSLWAALAYRDAVAGMGLSLFVGGGVGRAGFCPAWTAGGASSVDMGTATYKRGRRAEACRGL